MTPQLFASDRGSGLETVVLLHGFGGWHGTWDSIASEFSASCRFIAYDLPGHGRSLAFPEAGARRTARAILDDLSGRGIDSVHITGHSMGGAIAALIALEAPARVRSLTLLAPGGFGEEINGPLLRRYAAATSAQDIGDCLAAMSGPESTVSGRTVDALERMRAVPGQTERLVEIAAAITRSDRQGVIAADSLASLTMPVTVAWGTDDPVLPYVQTRNLPAGFDLRSAPEAGHMLIDEIPCLVAEILEAHVG